MPNSLYIDIIEIYSAIVLKINYTEKDYLNVSPKMCTQENKTKWRKNKMSFGKNTSKLTYLLITLIFVGTGFGVFIGWIAFNDGNGGDTYILNVQGSTTVEKICTLSAVPFMEAHPSVQVTISGTGSGTGIGTLINSQCDIAMASRTVKSTENDTAHTSTGVWLRQFTIAKDGLAIIINDDVTSILDLSEDTIKAIFNGTISNWSDTALPDVGLSSEIQVVVREEGSGTRDTFNELIMGDADQEFADSQYVGDALPMTSNQMIFDEVNTNPQAIGYVGLGYLGDGVESVHVDGVEPTFETVVDATYSIQRELYLVTLGDPEVGSLICEYVNWHFSPDGQYFVFDSGFINILPRRDNLI